MGWLTPGEPVCRAHSFRSSSTLLCDIVYIVREHPHIANGVNGGQHVAVDGGGYYFFQHVQYDDMYTFPVSGIPAKGVSLYGIFRGSVCASND